MKPAPEALRSEDLVQAARLSTAALTARAARLSTFADDLDACAVLERREALG